MSDVKVLNPYHGITFCVTGEILVVGLTEEYTAKFPTCTVFTDSADCEAMLRIAKSLGCDELQFGDVASANPNSACVGEYAGGGYKFWFWNGKRT